MSEVFDGTNRRPGPLERPWTGCPQHRNRTGWWQSLEKFETEEQSQREDFKRLEDTQCVALGMFHCDDPECATPRIPRLDEEHLVDLIASLEDPPVDLRKGSLASNVSMRAIRMDLLQAVFDAFGVYGDQEVATATVIKRGWTVRPNQLMSLTAAAIKNQFLTDLKRTGVTSIRGPLVAFLHGEYDPTFDVFVLHWHLVTLIEKAEALHRLKKLQSYAKTTTGGAPVVVKPVRNRTKQFSYLLKGFWPQKAVRDGVRDRKPHRIDEPYHTLHLAWLNQQRLRDITIMNGAWSRRKGGTDLMKALYFKALG